MAGVARWMDAPCDLPPLAPLPLQLQREAHEAGFRRSARVRALVEGAPLTAGEWRSVGGSYLAGVRGSRSLSGGLCLLSQPQPEPRAIISLEDSARVLLLLAFGVGFLLGFCLKSGC